MEYNDREEILTGKRLNIPQLLDQIPIDVLAGVLPSLEPVSYTHLTLPTILRV